MKQLWAKFFLGSSHLGQQGECRACRWLQQQGYQILHRNYRLGRDEADVIAQTPDGKTLVFIEVKTRRASNPLPEEAIDRKKQYRLSRFAVKYRQKHRCEDTPVRFDAIAIHWPEQGKPQFHHYPGAFEAPF